MIGNRSEESWRRLDETLRAFIARRVGEQEADDVLQESLFRIQRGVSELRDDERFGPWAYQVARSAIIDHLRASSRRRKREDAFASGDGEMVEEPDQRDEITERLVSCLPGFVAQLPSPYREAITLTELEGMTQKQAADLLGVSLSGMKSRVQRGRRQLRALFDECCSFSVDARGCVTGYQRRPIPTEVCCERPTGDCSGAKTRA